MEEREEVATDRWALCELVEDLCPMQDEKVEEERDEEEGRDMIELRVV